MTDHEQPLDERQSLALITTMIHKAKDVYHDTGISGILWGSVIAICSLVKLSEIHFNYRLPFDIYLLSFVAVVPQVIISIREKKSQRVKTYDDRFFGYLWLSFGICIFLLILLINVVFRNWAPVAIEYRELTGHASPFQFSEYIQSLFLLIYGFPTFVTGATCKFKPMFWGGLICWAFAVLAMFTSLKIDLLLVALAAIIAWLIPGILAEREYRKAKRMEAAHV
jgi:uncharacterized protein with PQ loop repeat